ncbi:hypothetical protein A6U87_05965 [Rhizobium sp. AC44/96]|uniref:hypothetical protein n=1 Tax=Rhizobium sp. AC44/96 TaxID=1841654 RepID=UPI00080FC0F2|nr:hypothetical protein [Rhizobium sp. AC44/96]OCJ12858.1 hypothetical protein A6U87_05965 [Rhizobium sp. AC44/96]
MAQNAFPSESFTNKIEASNAGQQGLNVIPPVSPVPLDYPVENFGHHQSLDDLRDEVALLQTRIATLQSRTSGIARAAARRADASAYAQLGHHPWLKLAAAMGATFVVSRALRRLPFGALVSAATPVLAMLARSGRGHR